MTRACIFLLLIVYSLSGCNKAVIEELVQEKLFSLSLGKMEDEIDLFQIGQQPFTSRNSIVIRDGLFYIANGNSSKIMEFSSYGDLIFLLYNPIINPKPVVLKSRDEETNASTKVTTRVAASYPFVKLGEIAVDGSKNIYVEDLVLEEESTRDAETGVALNRIILKFDRYGTFIHSIGQEGIGGTPYAYIDDIYITDRDELVVVNRLPEAWVVFWYSQDGELIYHVEIDLKHLPETDEEQIFMSLEKIVPDLNDYILYLMLYYFREEYDESTGTKSAIQNENAKIHRLHVPTGSYVGFIDIQEDDVREVRVGERIIEISAPTYELVGVSSTGHFFLIRTEDVEKYMVLILDHEGKEVKRGYVAVNDAALTYKLIELDRSGILFALLCTDREVDIVWWRSDRFIKARDIGS